MKISLAILFGGSSLALVGCLSGGPVPADKLSRSQAAIRSAQEIGAERSAEGSRHLMSAKAELVEGKKLVIEGEQERATSLLLRAEADAELAMNVTREATAIADAQKTREEVRALRMSMTTKESE
jgi:hypothetical protein